MLSFLSLIEDIPFDYLYGGSVANGANVEEAVPPEFATPQHFLHLGELFEQQTRGDALEYRNNSRGGETRRRGHEHVNVVAIGSQLNKLKPIPLADSPDYFADSLFNFFTFQHIVPILHNPNEMVLDDIPRMCGY